MADERRRRRAAAGRGGGDGDDQDGHAGRRLLVLGGARPLTALVAEGLRRVAQVEVAAPGPGAAEPAAGAPAGLDALVFVPSAGTGTAGPDLAEAESVLDRPGLAELPQLVLVSHAAVYEPRHTHPGLTGEGRLAGASPRNRVAAGWRRLESLFRDRLEGTAVRLAVVRPAQVLVGGEEGPLGRLFDRRIAITCSGYDPPLQFLDPDDLVQALRLIVARRAAGDLNLAPRGVVPLRAVLKLAGVRRLPLPLWGHLFGRRAGQRDYLRYSSTVGGVRAARILGFEPRYTSAEAVVRFRDAGRETPPGRSEAPSFDDFGMDPGFIAARARRLHGFLHDRWWRVDARGTENIPPGRAVLVGIHRGFMPWDGVMTLHSVLRGTGRYTRFLIHPTLVKFPFLFNLMTKMGGVVACRENADWVLERDGLLGMYPEGIRGAFSYYREAYELKRFGRDQFVRMALRQRAPLVPFVTLGSAETFPILAKLHWRWWKRFSEWPCLPITPTFPLLPVPLPSKWHTLFLPPMHIEKEHPPESADDPVVVARISHQVRERLARTLAEMRARRRSIFHGALVEPEPARQLP